jgi:hypothetical protein
MRVRAGLLRAGQAITAAAMSTAILLAAAPAAPSSAASGYPPPTVPNTSCSASEALAVGSSVTVRVTCLFAANATVTVTANGGAYNSGTADGSGVFTEVIVVSDPHVALNGGPAVATQVGGTTTFVATGPNPSGGTNTATTLVTVPAAAGTGASTASGSGSGAGSASGSLAFTGADLAAAVIAGLSLLAMGTMIVLYARRRAGRNASALPPG